MATTISGTTGVNKVADNADMPAGSVIQSYVRTIGPIVRSTAGSWSGANTITRNNTYEVETFTFTKKYVNSIVIGHCIGHVDVGGTLGNPSVVALTGGNNDDANGNLVLGSAYMHSRYANTEPYCFAFSFEDTRSSSVAQTYSLRTHSTADSMSFSRFVGTSTGQNPFLITLMEIAQ